MPKRKKLERILSWNGIFGPWSSQFWGLSVPKMEYNQHQQYTLDTYNDFHGCGAPKLQFSHRGSCHFIQFAKKKMVKNWKFLSWNSFFGDHYQNFEACLCPKWNVIIVSNIPWLHKMIFVGLRPLHSIPAKQEIAILSYLQLISLIFFQLKVLLKSSKCIYLDFFHSRSIQYHLLSKIVRKNISIFS